MRSTDFSLLLFKRWHHWSLGIVISLFIAAQAGLMPPITKRNDTMRAFNRTLTPAAKEAVSRALKAVKREVVAAKAAWVRETIDITQPPDDVREITPKKAWDAIRVLNRGPNARRKVDPMELYKDQSAGTDSGGFTTPEENREPSEDLLAGGHVRSSSGRQGAPKAPAAVDGQGSLGS